LSGSQPPGLTIVVSQFPMLLNFLVQVPEPEPGSIEVRGRFWKLAAQDLDEAADGEEVRFACISYSWGSGREPSPFRADFQVSDRTMPALNAFIRHRPSCKRVWIDAFCVPEEPEMQAYCLESMGYIYSRAEEVVVVLSSAARPALEHMGDPDRVEFAHLLVLENEGWVSRAWTYQETVNSRDLYITCEDSIDTLISGSDFLNCVGYGVSRLDCPPLERRQRFPRLDAFEDIIADYMVAGYGERSALQVMSNMDRRTQSRPGDHFYAMIGAISTDRASSARTMDPCEAFMSLCERKGDYSFIYSAARRDQTPSRRWRPGPGELPSLVPWHCWGASQPGREDEGGLCLDKMVVLGESPVGEDARQFAEQWLASTGCRAEDPQLQVHRSAYTALRLMGFSGSSACISTANGYFFPFESVLPDQLVSLLIATTVGWVFGAPGLACYNDGKGISYTPGVLIGSVDRTAATSVRIA
jgi:hypothetical protein